MLYLREWVEINRKYWFKEAIEAEKVGAMHCYQVIFKTIINFGVEEEDKQHTWMKDMETYAQQGGLECTRAVYAHILTFSNKISIWLHAAYFKKTYGTRESLEALLQRAVADYPKSDALWLMDAKSKLAIQRQKIGAKKNRGGLRRKVQRRFS